MKRLTDWKKLLSASAVTCIAMVFTIGAVAEDGYSGAVSNGVTLNGIGMNGIGMNGIGMNGVALNGVALQQLGVRPSSLQALVTNERTRSLVEAIAECALTENDELEVEADGATHVFPGLLGLAPELKDKDGLSPSGQHWVTACLLARVNYFGVHLPVSLNGAHPALAPSMDEEKAYSVEEGAFFGNLFSESPYAVSCIGRHGQDREASPDLKHRLCATDLIEDRTVCGFEAAGYCEAVCKPTDSGRGYTDCRSFSADGDGAVSEVITVFLRDAEGGGN